MYLILQFCLKIIAGMLLQPCHLLLRLLYSFMLEWMPWTLKSGDLLVTGTI